VAWTIEGGNKKMLRVKSLIVGVCMFAVLPIGASSASGTPEEQAACRPDVIKFCKPTGSGNDEMAILFCLKENRSKLSRACLKVLADNGQ
jgi:hypothetical protein